MKRSLLLALPLLAAQLAFAQSSAVPGAISYQGRVADANGVLIGDTGPVNRKVTLRIYDAATATTPIYAEEQTVTLNKGVFSVLVGQGLQVGSEPRPAIATVFNGSERFLGVTVDDGGAAPDPEITPRQQIVSTAFAFTAKNAEVAGSVQQASGTSNMNWLTVNNMTVNGHSKITDQNVLEFGVGKTKTDAAGQIGYQSLSEGLDIVGAGESAAERKITMHAQGGTDFLGSINFGSRTAQHINLFDNTFGIGIQANTLYNRTAGAFSWYRGGVHDNGAGQAGGGGQHLATLHAGGLNLPVGPVDRGDHGNFVQSYGGGHSYGSQDWTTFARTARHFAWYLGGGFHRDELNAGGGQQLMKLNNDGLSVTNGISAGGSGSVNGNFTIGGDFLRVGANRPGLESNSGVLALGQYSFPGLSIVGGGVTANQGQIFSQDDGNFPNRSVKIWAEGGTYFTGGVRIEYFNGMHVLGYRYYNNTTIGNGGNRYEGEVSLYAVGRVIGSEFNATSDSRIKKVKGQSDAAADLKTLMDVKITDYTKVDDVGARPREYKKVIAQELEAVFPQAVSKTEGTVPDIFRKFSAENGFVAVKEPLANPVKVGDAIKLYLEMPDGARKAAAAKASATKSNEKDTAAATDATQTESAQKPMSDVVETVVTEVTKDGFRLKEKVNGNIFIYGRKVQDLRVVDYEAIAMLNVSAAQEMNRKIEAQRAQIIALEDAKAALEKELTAAKAANTAQDTRLAAIEKALDLRAPAAAPGKKETKVASRR